MEDRIDCFEQMLADTPTGLRDLTNEYQKAERHEDVAAGLVASSLHDAEGKMRYSRGLYHPGALQLDRLRAQVIEQSDTVPEQEGYQVYVYLIKKSRPDALLRDTGGAQGPFRAVVGPSDETIQRHRESRRDFAHVHPPVSIVLSG